MADHLFQKYVTSKNKSGRIQIDISDELEKQLIFGGINGDLSKAVQEAVKTMKPSLFKSQ